MAVANVGDAVFGRHGRMVAAVLALAVLSTACASGDPASGGDVDPELQAADSTTRPVSFTLAEFWAVADETIALPRLSFDLRVTSAIPGVTDSVVSVRSGSFDDDSLTGFGRRSFETGDEELRERLGERPFEFRFVDLTFWFLNALAEPPRWSGIDADDLFDVFGGDPLPSIDGDLLFAVAVNAATDVVDVRQQPDGGRTWVLDASADGLLELVSAGGPAARLMDAGAADSGLSVRIELEESADGHFVRLRADMSEWWTRAVNLVAPTDGTQSMDVDFRLMAFDAPLNVERPCDDPTPTVTDDGVQGLVCADRSADS